MGHLPSRMSNIPWIFWKTFKNPQKSHKNPQETCKNSARILKDSIKIRKKSTGNLKNPKESPRISKNIKVSQNISKHPQSSLKNPQESQRISKNPRNLKERYAESVSSFLVWPQFPPVPNIWAISTFYFIQSSLSSLSWWSLLWLLLLLWWFKDPDVVSNLTWRKYPWRRTDSYRLICLISSCRYFDRIWLNSAGGFHLGRGGRGEQTFDPIELKDGINLMKRGQRRYGSLSFQSSGSGRIEANWFWRWWNCAAVAFGTGHFIGLRLEQCDIDSNRWYGFN